MTRVIPTSVGRVALPRPRPARPRGGIGVSSVFGTFGELLQGVLPGPAGDFLVTLPIARWTVATFEHVPGSNDVQALPVRKDKARRMAEMVLEWAGCANGGVLTIDSTLPEGKGMASSSADLVATARAVGNALQVPLTAERIEMFLGRIEPSDGVLYSAIVAFDHRTVRLRRILGSLPTMTIIGVDEGGTVDTVAFNQIAKPFTAADRQEYACLLDRLTAAVSRHDLAEVGAVATRSAEMNQALRPKHGLERMMSICDEVGALGVVAAHSGTMLGILLDIRDPAYLAKLGTAVRACTAVSDDVTIYRTLTLD